MRITENRLRQIIREEMTAMHPPSCTATTLNPEPMTMTATRSATPMWDHPW